MNRRRNLHARAVGVSLMGGDTELHKKHKGSPKSISNMRSTQESTMSNYTIAEPALLRAPISSPMSLRGPISNPMSINVPKYNDEKLRSSVCGSLYNTPLQSGHSQISTTDESNDRLFTGI